MGVRGLHKLINTLDLLDDVNIKTIAKEYKQQHGLESDPIIVVDGQNLIYTLYGEIFGIDWVCGGQAREYIQSWQQFVNQFKENHIQLAFVFDGMKNEDISDTRKNESDKKVRSVFHQLSHYPSKGFSEMMMIPTAIIDQTSYILRHYCNCEVYNCIDEDDDTQVAEIALARKDCFAVLSNDSDFFIYDTKPLIVSHTLKLNAFNNVSNAKMFVREKLEHKLGIDRSLLPLFAYLLGNDFIQYEQSKRFHSYINGNEHPYDPYITVQNIINYLRSIWCDIKAGQDLYLTKVSQDIYGNEEFVDHIERALKFYVLTGESKLLQKENLRNNYIEEKLALAEHIIDEELTVKLILKRINSAINLNLINLIFKGTFATSNSLEDSSKPDEYHSRNVYKTIRLSCYDIIFQSLLSEEELIFIEEYIFYPGCDSTEHYVILKRWKEDVISYDIKSLWSENISNHDKMKAFMTCLNLSDWFQLNHNLISSALILPICLLKYLNKKLNECIQNWELDALLAHILLMPLNDWKKCQDIVIDSYDASAIHLASIFTSGILYLQFINDVCGQPFAFQDTMIWNYFDGKLFHQTYLKLSIREVNIDQILVDKNLSETFNSMTKFIHD